MKPLKKSNHHNTEINKDCYTKLELRKMLQNHEIFFYDENFKPSYETRFCESKDLRIFLDDMKEIKVIMNKYGYYTNIAVNQAGEQYFICL